MNFFERHKLIEWRAARIEDPVERLRFLREHAHPGPALGDVVQRHIPAQFWRKRAGWIVLALATITLMALRPGRAHVHAEARPASLAQQPPIVYAGAPVTPQAPGNIWLVEQRNGFENYSNGLRIDDKYAVSNETREKYPVFAYGKPGADPAEWRTEPAGIVYHTTESHQAPFEPGQNRRLVRIGTAVVEFVQQNRSYHFVIDRFGRVFRVVKESDIAWHAGRSVWGDEKKLYLDLNHSFLGIAFETATDTDAPTATAAQIHSGRVLTEMLRAKYRIPASNCVTHAQVSVNASNMLLGYHTDWGGVFPFVEMGLPDNYLRPPPAMLAFGFGYDTPYIDATANHLAPGLLAAEQELERQAKSAGLPAAKYKAALQQRYRQIEAVLNPKSPGKEKGDET